MKRKRVSCSIKSKATNKRQKRTNLQEQPSIKTVDHPVLSRYYTKVLTLREYLLSHLPSTSKRRRQLIRDVGKPEEKKLTHNNPRVLSSQSRYKHAILLLDGVLVGFNSTQATRSADEEQTHTRDFETFSQQLIASGSTALKSQLGSCGVSLSDLIDFAIWVLFNRKHPNVYKPPHVLCHGTLRSSSTWDNRGVSNSCSIPGLVRLSPNEHVKELKSSAWTSMFDLLGKGGDRIFLDLLISCGLFMPMDASSGTYYQLSGHVLSDIQPIQDNVAVSAKRNDGKPSCPTENTDAILRSSSDIRFVRSRMFYARAALNAKREVAFGLRHIHVLNRYSDPANASHTAHVMKYIFPRQFRLHNVFTSKTDAKETSQPFHDYTLREREIARADMTRKVKGLGQSSSGIAHSIPKRLRGKTFQLIRKLQTLHQRCSYTKLLAHYCPLPDSASSLTTPKSSGLKPSGNESPPDFTSLATSPTQVSAFVRAVVSRVFPHQLFGEDVENRKLLNKNIDAFVKIRRFESLTLETVLRGIKIRSIRWLKPPHLDENRKMSQSDFQKRLEIFSELIYYIFDSFVIPLIRTNFHVTESSAHRNRLFYFRHDIWRRLTEPALNNLKVTLYDEIGGEKVLKPLEKRTLGFSQIRLLPKESGMRPITNLRRRAQVLQNGRTILGRSINSALAPAFSVLNYEKQHQPARLGASLFSIGGIYEKLRLFRQTLTRRGQMGRKLYFAKVDVKGCFDSIPQKKMTQLIQQLMSAHDYRITRHAEVKPAEFQDRAIAKPTRKFAAEVQVGEESRSFTDMLGQRNKPIRNNTIFVDSVVPQHMEKKQVSQLLHEHVENNIVKIGKKFYRQKQGIPQGSVVSSLLCNFFYGDLEYNHLAFLHEDDSVLFRLIDDFLLITTDAGKARRFLEIMHAGIPSYGVSVKPQKSLANFKVDIGSKTVSRHSKDKKFPYCGILIDSHSLDISKDSDSLKRGSVADSLTVEHAKRPGQNFKRKILSALKIQMHTMLVDTSHNSTSTVLANVYQSMVEVAVKACYYMRCLGKHKQPSVSMLECTVEELAGLAFAMLRSKRNKQRCSEYQCSLSKTVTQCITIKAFMEVFGRRQTKFKQFLARLEARYEGSQGSSKFESRLLEHVSRLHGGASKGRV